MKTFFTFLLSAISLMAYPQWYWVNPTPTGYNLNDVCFVDEYIGYVVGDKGTILKTEDSGVTWTTLTTGSLRNYNMAFFITENTGYITSGKFLMKTTDGGQSWSEIETGAESPFSDIFFLTEEYGFLTATGTILKTTDGGISWTKALIPGYKHINSIHFPSESIGYATGVLGMVLKTIDGGHTWETTIIENMLEMRDVFFVTNNTGFIAGEQGFSMKTNDGGITWSQLSTNYNLKELYFLNGLVGFAISGSDLVKTTNGGLTWSVVGMTDIGNFDFISENKLFGVGAAGRLYKSEDQGVTFTNYSYSATYDHFSDIHFPTPSVGYAITEWGDIVKTTDAGNNWSLISSGQFNRLFSLWFTTPDIGYIASGNSIFKTNDGGITWNEMIVSDTGVFYYTELQFVNENTGFITSEYDGLIFRTDDAGVSWSVVYQNINDQPVRAIQFLNQDTGFVALSNSVLKTTDGGQSWIEFTDFPIENIFESMFFVNSQTGYVGSFYYGWLYKTTDGGETWTDLSDPSRIYPVMSMYFTSETTGYLTSDGLYQTNNGGNTWVHLDYVNHGMSKLWFTDNLTGYLAGSSGMILKTTNAGAVPVLSPDKPDSEFTLYPNPASDDFTLTSNSVTEPFTISIYNSNGLCIYFERYTTSTIKVSTEALPSGLYFLRINYAKGAEVKKLVIL